MKIRMNLFEMIQELEKQERRSISIQDIADETKISRNTLSLLMRGDTRMVRFETLEALIVFFRSRGMNVRLEELLVLEEGETLPVEMAFVG